jgi:hypothetical protein
MRTFVDKQALAVASAIIVAIGFYWLAAKLMTFRDAGQINPGSVEVPIVSEGSQEAIVEEIRKKQLRLEELINGYRKLQITSPAHRLIFYEYPDGHPYGRAPETDLIIKTPQPLSGKPFSGMDRGLQIKLEENAGTRRDSGNH